MKSYEKIGFIFGIIGIFVLSVAAVTVNRFRGNAQSNTAYQQPSSVTPAPAQSGQTSVVYVHSSDGKKQVIMRTKMQADNSVLYTFSTADVPDPDSTPIKSGSIGASPGETVFFTRSIGGSGKMTVPSNTWSPDNKYLFLEEDEAGFTDIYVFKADGSLFDNGRQYLNVSSLFAQKQTNYAFSSVSGWDSNTLLHVFTTTNGKDPGPRFWFEVPSTSFIQLAS